MSFHVNEFSWNYTAKTTWIRDFLHFWAFQELSILPGRASSRDPAGSAPHIPAGTSWILALGFLQCQAGGAALLPAQPCYSHRDGAGSPAKGTGMSRDGGEEEEGGKKNPTKCERNESALTRQGCLSSSPFCSFPGGKQWQGKGGGRISFSSGRKHPLFKQLDKSRIS